MVDNIEDRVCFYVEGSKRSKSWSLVGVKDHSGESGVADRRDAEDRRGAAAINSHSRCSHKEFCAMPWIL